MRIVKASRFPLIELNWSLKSLLIFDLPAIVCLFVCFNQAIYSNRMSRP